MKVFISWSGETGREIAEALRDWLPSVLQAVKPFFSPDDVAKGTRWFPEISGNLQECEMGLICLTPDNLNAPWILFEAGALSKNVGKAKVCTLLFNLSPTDVTGPLAQLNHTRFDKEDMKRLVGTINKELAEQSLAHDVLEKIFEKWWPDLENLVKEILSAPEPQTPLRRSEREILEEVLNLTRQSAISITYIRDRSPFLESLPMEDGGSILSQEDYDRIMSKASDLSRMAGKYMKYARFLAPIPVPNQENRTESFKDETQNYTDTL